MTLLNSVLMIALIGYVLNAGHLTPARDNALRLCVSVLVLTTMIYNVYLFAHDMMAHHYDQAAINAVVSGADVFIFRVFWSGLGLRLFREKAGVLAPGRVWVCMIDTYMYLNPSLTGLARQVVTEWCDDKHLVG